MRRQGELGRFLQVCRARLRPEDVELVPFGERRRVPGLRREELAGLAGVSPSYYARLEQGQSGASVQVLQALAAALRLDEHEQAHLFDLSRPAPARSRSALPRTERVHSATRELVRALGDSPVLVTSASGDVLMWNRTGHALFAWHTERDAPERSDDRPNTARMLFLDPHARDLWTDWAGKARAVVEHLQLVHGRRPDDRQLHLLVEELESRSPEFAALWADHGVRACPQGRHRLRHPLVGVLTVTQQTLQPTTTPEQSVVVFTARPGSASEGALLDLAHLSRQEADASHAPSPAGRLFSA